MVRYKAACALVNPDGTINNQKKIIVETVFMIKYMVNILMLLKMSMYVLLKSVNKIMEHSNMDLIFLKTVQEI